MMSDHAANSPSIATSAIGMGIDQKPHPHGVEHAGHDHASCISRAMAAASERCARRGERLTPLRQRVLELIWGSHRPVGAYALLDVLRTEQRAAAPPTVYRTLDFLIAQGLVHRLESLNAYIGCPDPERAHPGQILICRDCSLVEEIDDAGIAQGIRAAAAAHGFVAERPMVEIAGLCRDCAAKAAA